MVSKECDRAVTDKAVPDGSSKTPSMQLNGVDRHGPRVLPTETASRGVDLLDDAGT